MHDQWSKRLCSIPNLAASGKDGVERRIGLSRAVDGGGTGP